MNNRCLMKDEFCSVLRYQRAFLWSCFSVRSLIYLASVKLFSWSLYYISECSLQRSTFICLLYILIVLWSYILKPLSFYFAPGFSSQILKHRLTKVGSLLPSAFSNRLAAVFLLTQVCHTLIIFHLLWHVNPYMDHSLVGAKGLVLLNEAMNMPCRAT